MPSSPTDLQQYRGDDGSLQPARLQQAIELLSASVTEEFQISERLNTKGRQTFGLAAGLFAVTQAVAFGGFGLVHLGGAEGVLVASLAVLAAIALIVCADRLVKSEELLPEAKIKPDSIAEWVQKSTDTRFAQQVIVHLAYVVNDRHSHNEQRAEKYKELETAAQWALVLTAAELAVALIFRA